MLPINNGHRRYLSPGWGGGGEYEGGKDERHIDSADIQVSIGELIESFKWIS